MWGSFIAGVIRMAAGLSVVAAADTVAPPLPTGAFPIARGVTPCQLATAWRCDGASCRSLENPPLDGPPGHATVLVDPRRETLSRCDETGCGVPRPFTVTPSGGGWRLLAGAGAIVLAVARDGAFTVILSDESVVIIGRGRCAP